MDRESCAVWQAWGRVSSSGISSPSSSLVSSLAWAKAQETALGILREYLVKKAYVKVGRDYSGYLSLPNEHDCAAFLSLIITIGIKPKVIEPSMALESKKSISPLLPFGALNKTTLLQAKEILSQLAQFIKGSKERLRSHDNTRTKTDLVSHYFSLVPLQVNESGFPSLLDESIHRTEEAKIDSWLANYPEEMWKQLRPRHTCNSQTQLQDELDLEEMESLGKITAEYTHISDYFL